MGAIIGEWQRGPVIGRGASATVSIAADRRTGEVFAVKSVEAARAGVLKREQSVLAALSSSPYVVSCLGSGVSPAADGGGSGAPLRFDLFLEYAPGGSLADEIRRRGGRCEEAVIRSRAADVLRGLAFVHGAGVAHCDVKGRNVLLGADGRAMLADFGCARWTSAAAAGYEDSNAGGEMMIRGTPMFMAPEAARGEAQGAAADIWALGCTVIEMATGAAPWPQRFADPVAALHHVAHSGEVPEPPAWLSDEGKDFLARCLVRDPAARWTAEQLLHHPFVAGDNSGAAEAAKGLLIEQRVSPKSILDQGFWEESDSSSATDDSDSDSTAQELSPADRVRALASDVAPDWTWSTGEQWITVCAHPDMADDNDIAASPGFEAEAGTSATEASEEHIGGGGEHMGVDAPLDRASASRGHDHGGPSPLGEASSGAGSRRGDNAIIGSNNIEHCSSGNSASRGNKKQVIKNPFSELVNPPSPSWQPFFHFPARRFHSSLFFFSLTFPARPFSSRARREP